MRDYIVQVARFDPSKGIPDVIKSYVEARRILDDRIPGSKHPQLALVGHGAVDDPDATIIYDQIMDMLEDEEFSQYASDIVVMRLPASDQCTSHTRNYCANLNSAECDHVERKNCLAIVLA
jgi:alpha,alpha-trehalose phosphorylase (configuration-retaining)